MKKYDLLKIVVIFQAIGMLALATFLIWQLWPTLQSKSTDHNQAMQNEDDSFEQLDEVIAVIADKQITQKELMQQLIELYGDQTLDHMLLHQAILLAAEEEEISLTDQELEAAIHEATSGYESREQYFAMMKEQLGYSEKKVIEDISDHALLVKIAIANVQVSQAEIVAYIQAHANQFEQQRYYRLSWILTENNSDADSIMTELMLGADFAELASQYSIDEFTAAAGGDLGEVASKDPFYDPVMLEQAAKMKVGNITGPIETEDGYAILRLVAVHETDPFSQQEKEEKARVEISLQQIGSLQEVQDKLKNKYLIKIKK